MTETVGESLSRIADQFIAKSSEYGDSYKQMGPVLKSLFPNGIVLNTEREFNRFSHFVQLVYKLNRYAFNFEQGGHCDSMNDLAIGSQLMNEIDSHSDNVERVLNRLKNDQPLTLNKPAFLGHDLYKTGDKDCPTSILDSNGEVVLGLCRKCGKGESELEAPCPVTAIPPAKPTMPPVWAGEDEDGDP